MLKDAAKLLNINYSTAKTILRVFRKEKRIEKKYSNKEDIPNIKSTENDTQSLKKVCTRKEEDEIQQVQNVIISLENIHKYVSSNFDKILKNQVAINIILNNMSRIQVDLNEISRNIFRNFHQGYHNEG